jgi:membrane protein insertase Oxa1/YidC/SpoIIIJ
MATNKIRYLIIYLCLNNVFSHFQTYSITDTVDKIAESYGCKPIEGMLSHQVPFFYILKFD